LKKKEKGKKKQTGFNNIRRKPHGSGKSVVAEVQRLLFRQKKIPGGKKRGPGTQKKIKKGSEGKRQRARVHQTQTTEKQGPHTGNQKVGSSWWGGGGSKNKKRKQEILPPQVGGGANLQDYAYQKKFKGVVVDRKAPLSGWVNWVWVPRARFGGGEENRPKGQVGGGT